MLASSSTKLSKISCRCFAHPDVVRSIGEMDRANLAKYLTIAKLKLENAIAVVRTADTD